MEVRLSELKLQRYDIIDSKLGTHNKKTYNLDETRKEIYSRNFEIDKTDNFVIELQIENKLNKRKKESGYDFFVNLSCLFSLDGLGKLPKEQKGQYLLYSALPMTVGIARTHLSMLTTNAIFGKYILPAIDLPNLIEMWANKHNTPENQ